MPSVPEITEVLIIPILINVNKNELFYYDQNPFYNNWSIHTKKYSLLNYNLPNQDLEDFQIIKKNIQNIENYNFKEILKKYNFENYIIMIIFKRINEIKFYSKINFEDKLVVLNKSFVNKNIKKQSDLNSIILYIKNSYEDNWKSINKMNPYTSVPIRLSVESDNVEKSLKLENALTNLDFVNNYKIEKFNSNEIIYKIYYSSNPKRFLKDILSYDIYVDTSSTNWKIK